MKKTRLRIGIVAVLLIAMIAVILAPVEAKTYYQFAGHAAVRYEHWNIPYGLQPYVNKIEYDAICAPKTGVRLYLYDSAKYAINSASGDSIAKSIASYIRSNPEWIGDRSLDSVKLEILFHSAAAVYDPSKINPTHVEYYYKDLQWWEVYRNI